MFYTQTDELRLNEDYLRVTSVLEKMYTAGSIHMGMGYCISMSEMVRISLLNIGVKSKLVECQLTINNNNSNRIEHIGFDNIKDPGQIDTHVVVVTETNPVLLIDASIANKLPEHCCIVVDELKEDELNIILNSSSHNIDLIYQKKNTSKVTFAIQNSILDRINTDRTIFEKISFLKYLVIVALCVSFLNFTRGLYDFYQTHVSYENTWGPSGIILLKERLEKIEQKLEK